MIQQLAKPFALIGNNSIFVISMVKFQEKGQLISLRAKLTMR